MNTIIHFTTSKRAMLRLVKVCTDAGLNYKNAIPIETKIKHGVDAISVNFRDNYFALWYNMSSYDTTHSMYENPFKEVSEKTFIKMIKENKNEH